MNSRTTFVSLVSLLLVNPLRAQTGAGCPIATCDHPGQVRIDAIVSRSGYFLGGCNCACPLDHGCPYGFIPQFDPVTLTGDCSCVPNYGPEPQPVPVNPSPASPSPANPNQPSPQFPSTPGAPTLPNKPALPQMPQPPANVVSTPPVEVTCTMPGPCECPAGTQAPCIITCDGVDGCKDAVVRCNNDFFPCEVHCFGDKACASSTIEGPAGAPLTTHCSGEFSCEGNVKINGVSGTDMTVHCDGMTSCKGHTVLEYGVGRASLNCNGDPDSCQGVVINLPSNAFDMPGMAWQCNGLFCPTYAPPAFSNMVGSAEMFCSGPGSCSCPAGLRDVCTLNCAGSAGGDACKDGLIECNNDGFDCIVNCMDFESCAGATSIMGPAGGSLTVQCLGDKSCEGSFTVNGEMGTDLTTVCQGPEACKGNAQLNFGSGRGAVFCNGGVDTCLGVNFNLPMNADAMPGFAFSCQGPQCPASAPAPFSNVVPTWAPRPVPQPVPQPPTPQPTFVWQWTPVPQPQPVPVPQPAQPVPVPQPAQPVPQPVATPYPTTRIVDPVYPVYPSYPPRGPMTTSAGPRQIGGAVTPWCCHTSIPNTVSWQGICWGKMSTAACNEAPNGRCEWDTSRCFQSAPQCLMQGDVCRTNEDCCSNACRITGTESTCK